MKIGKWIICSFTENQFSSLFQNLLDNAIKYSNPNSKVLISTQDELNWIKFDIKDDGIGISKKDQASIFDLFYRVGDEMTRKTNVLIFTN